LCLPFFYNDARLGDEGIWLNGAERLLSGERLYSDFFEFLPPGSFLIVEGWFRIVGQSFFAARILAMLTIAGIAYFTYLSCLEASKHLVISAASALAWAIWSQLVWNLQVSHHWFTTLLSMISAWAAIRSIRLGPTLNSMPLLSGFTAGAASIITPHNGALTALASLTAFLGPAGTRQAFFKFTAGCLVIPILICLYLVSRGSFAAAFADVILFPATRFSYDVWSVPYANGGTRSNPLKYVHSIDAVMIVLVCVLGGRSAWSDRTLRSSAALALAGIIGIYPRPDLAHIAFTLPLSLPLTAYCLAAFAVRLRPKLVIVAAALVVLLELPNANKYYEAATQSLNATLTRTPRGFIALRDYGAAELVGQLSTKAGAFFFYPNMPLLPYLMAKKQVSKYDVFVPFYTTAAQYGEATKDVLERASEIVVDTKWNNEEFLLRALPAMKPEKDKNKEEFERALYNCFTLEWQSALQIGQYSQFQILRRITEAPADSCSKVP
jgi:hypothetical protein